MSDQNPEKAPRERATRFISVSLTKPVLASALGVDGGAVFQVLAVEDLGLSASAIGLAFGLGLLSLPLQLWAARIPLRFARRNVQLFLVFAAVQCVALALLLAVGATGGLAASALVVTVTAEVAISVLFVTAWQPLLSTRARSRDRQRINAGWAAMGRGLLAGFLVAFSAVETTGRALLLLALALVAVAVAVSFGRVTVTDVDAVPAKASPKNSPTATPPALTRAGWWILGSSALLNLGSLPLWLVHLSDVLWPTVSLGAIGAIQTASAVAALLAWRPAKGKLGRRALVGAGMVVAGSTGLLSIGRVASSHGEQGAVVLVTIVMTFGMTYTSLALLEMTHRIVEQQRGVVRMFTLVDVVESSALQLGLLVAGALVSWTVHTVTWSPYVAFVAIVSALSMLAVWRTVVLMGDSARDAA